MDRHWRMNVHPLKYLRVRTIDLNLTTIVAIIIKEPSSAFNLYIHNGILVKKDQCEEAKISS